MQKISAYSSHKIYAVAVALSILCALFLFVMSSEPAPESAYRSGSIADALASFFIDGFDELDEADRTLAISDIDYVIRKTAHFSVYATLGGLIAVASLYHKRRWRAHLLIPFLLGTVYAISDEVHQAFVPGRGPLVTDVILDSCGVLCGTVLVIGIAKRMLKPMGVRF